MEADHVLISSLSGYLLVTLALLTAHLGGAHSTWSGGQPFFAKIAAFWIGLPLIWLGLLLRVRYVRPPDPDKLCTDSSTSKMQFRSS